MSHVQFCDVTEHFFSMFPSRLVTLSVLTDFLKYYVSPEEAACHLMNVTQVYYG